MNSVVSMKGSNKRRRTSTFADAKAGAEKNPAAETYQDVGYLFTKGIQDNTDIACKDRLHHAALVFHNNDSEGFTLEELEAIVAKGKAFPGMGLDQATKEPIRVAYRCAAASVACLHEVASWRNDLKAVHDGLVALISNNSFDVNKGISPTDIAALKKHLIAAKETVMQYLRSTDPSTFSNDILPLPGAQI